jgi:hypothetical protein
MELLLLGGGLDKVGSATGRLAFLHAVCGFARAVRRKEEGLMGLTRLGSARCVLG